MEKILIENAVSRMMASNRILATRSKSPVRGATTTMLEAQAILLLNVFRASSRSSPIP